MQAAKLLQRYFEVFAAGNAEAAAALFGAGALYEFPFLRPRLVGSAEILAGHKRAFEVASRIAVSLRAVRGDGATAIAEGRLTAHVARDDRTVDLPFAAVAEAAGDRLTRLSIYCDAHSYRLWTDGPVMAFAR